MADRSCRQKDNFQKTTGPAHAQGLGPPRPTTSRAPPAQAATPQQHSPIHQPGRQNPSSDCHLPTITLGPQTRDSGYNTDVSPATTSSPATNATSRQHFVFDNLPDSGVQHHLAPAAAAAPPPLSAFSAPRSPHAHVLEELCDPRATRKSTHPLRLSPEIFKISEQRSSFSPRPVSETSDSHVVVFDFEIGGDDDNNATEKPEDFGCGQPGGAEAGESPGPFDRGCSIDENLLYDSDGIMRRWGQSPDPTLRCRASSFCAKPRRRHCSTGDDSAASMTEAFTRWCDPGTGSGTFAQRSYSFSESCSDTRCDDPGHHHHHEESPDFGQPGLQRRSRFSPLAASQGFQCGGGCYDYSVSRSDSCESENVFSFDLDGIEDDDEEEDDYGGAFAQDRGPPHHRGTSSGGVPIIREKPPHSPASTSRLRRRRTGLAASHLHISGGVRLPCSGTIVGVSVATQTPHVASTLIQQILSTPVPLPNEAIGPAASSLRRRSSASGALLGVPSSSAVAPLPDIVPTTGRDRSNSVPDFHAYERAARARETGRQVGRELRRMSDEFNSFSFLGVRRLSPVSEDFNGYSSSFPITRPRGFFHRVRSFIQENISRGGLRRQDSSVDLTEHSTPEEDGASPQSLDRTLD